MLGSMWCLPLGLRLAVSLLLCGLGRPASAAAVDVADALSRLSAASVQERAAAERDLAGELQLADAALLSEAARAGSAEVRARIAAALMSDARHFALAAELAAKADPEVARTGALAIAGQASAWLGSSDQDPLPLAGIERTVRGSFSGLWSLDISRGELEPLLDQIARLVSARRDDRPGLPAPPIVLDPSFDPRQSRPLSGAEDLGPIVVGSFDQLLYGVVVTHGALFDVYGWNEGRTWIVVRPVGVRAGRSAQALLLEWVLAVQRGGASPGAARALASCGWPAALEWLDLRWRKTKDPAAFEGLVLAAGRGAIGASLESPLGAQALLERADFALAGPGGMRQQAAELARALQSLGALAAPSWKAGFAAASVRARMLRCALVAGARVAPTDFVDVLRSQLLAIDTSAEERCALLRALSALGLAPSQDLQVPGIEAAFAWALEHDSGRAFPTWLRAIGAREPPVWHDPRSLPPAAQIELCADALAHVNESKAARETAASRLAALLAQPRGEELALALFERESLWVPPAQLRAALLGARGAGADSALIARVSLCSGLATAEEGRELTEAVFASDSWSASDWRVAGAAIAKVGGVLDDWPRKPNEPGSNYAIFLQRLEKVREQVQATPAGADVQGLDAGWVQGCERCLSLLRSRQSEPGAREFLRNLRVLFQRTSHALRRELSLGRFPVPSSAVVVEVEGLEPWVGF